ncbi:unnamed protein product [Echinostoma caproni]|uniref:PI3K/PI4K domain-containing protein n=1 Tax=Echinostoma caproni TaxID=27848 RepID=A0A183B2S6_9TREM|nr:unnamed protein product [Echinostoma caproni]
MLRMEEMIMDLKSKGAGAETGEVPQPDRIDREWAQLVFTYPQVVSVWRGYLCYLMGRCGGSNLNSTQYVGGGLFAKIDTIFKRALSKLSGIISGRILSHRPLPQTAEQTIDLLADYCQWLVQAGHAERALAIWQLVIEFNCFRPPELEHITYDQCMLEMELFWNSGVARFGQPGSEHWSGWYRSRGKSSQSDFNRTKDKKSEKKSKRASACAFALEEIPLEASREELASKWSSVTDRLKSIATSCEDALMHSSTDSLAEDSAQKMDVEVVPSVLSAATTDDQWVRRGAVPSLTGCAPIGKSRMVLYRRGKAWVGLERARESVGWLPADTLAVNGGTGDIEDEDPERLVLFDDVKHCLLDLTTLDSRSLDSEVMVGDMTSRVINLQQRLLLQCLAFLGAFDPESAAAHGLPADLRIVHDLSTVGSIQRQSLAPLATQSFALSEDVQEPGSRSRFSNPSGTHLDAWSQARRCVLDTAVVQAGHMHRWNNSARQPWLVTMARLRYRVALERLVEAIRAHSLESKVRGTGVELSDAGSKAA